MRFLSKLSGGGEGGARAIPDVRRSRLGGEVALISGRDPRLRSGSSGSRERTHSSRQSPLSRRGETKTRVFSIFEDRVESFMYSCLDGCKGRNETCLAIDRTSMEIGGGEDQRIRRRRHRLGSLQAVEFRADDIIVVIRARV